MYYVQDKEQSALSKLQWNSAYFTVSEFLKKFSLPQIVKVVGGFYGEDEETTLSGNQLLCLHSIKSIEKVNGRDGNGREISILADCRNKVEVRPSNLKDVYKSVKELCTMFPRHVRISQGYYNSSTDEEILNVGDKLYLKSVNKTKNGEETLICVNQNGQTIELPKDCTAGFQPLADGKEYYLSEVVKKFPMPVYVQFVDPFSIGEETPSEDKSRCQPLGTISLRRKVAETVVIATSIRDDGRRSTVTFSPEVDICLVVSEDMLRNSTDYNELCQSLGQYIDFQNISPDIYEYVDEMNLSSKKLKLPNSKKPKSSKHDTKKGGKLTGFLRRHSVGKTSRPSKKDQTDESGQMYAEESDIYDEIEPTTTECNKESVYTELDPTYIATTSHEYAKPLKQADQLTHANPVTPTAPNSEKQPASSNPPDNLTALPDSPPQVPTKSRIPNRPPQLPKRPAVPDKKPALPDRRPSTPGQLLPISESSTMLPTIPDNMPAIPSSPSDRPPSLPISQKPAITPELQKDEIHEAIAKFPTDLSSLSVADVSRLLKYLGMKSCVEIFKAELVDGEMLASMDKESLESLNISVFHVKKLLKFIGGWRPNVQ